MITKELIINTLNAQLHLKLVNYKKSLNDLHEGNKNETKSSAGDKYETSRSMTQIEIAMISNQIQKTELDLATINLASKKVFNKKLIESGSLILTCFGYYFLAISFGKLKINNEHVMVLSPNSPIGKLLTNSKLGKTIVLNGQEITILEIIE